MARRYEYLRRQMSAQDVSETYLARRLNLCMQSVSDRLRNKTPWRMEEMWQVMAILHLPPEELHKCFPPGGVTDGKLPRLRLVEAK